MIDLLPPIRFHFDGLQDRLRCFYNYEVQVEGWFKGELLTILDRLRAEGVVSSIDREVHVGTKRLDLVLDLRDGRHWVELKYWLVGKQRGSRYRTTFYFGDPTSVGIKREVEALRQIREPGNRWLLLLVVGNPGKDDWELGLAKHREKFGYNLASRSSPSDFPDTYFLGLLEVES